MVPDKGFTKQLKKIDPELEVCWDWGAEKWEIWCFPTDGRDAYMVTRVQAKGKSYRELGQDVLMNRLNVANASLFQLNWFACVLGGAHDARTRRLAG